MLEGGLVKSHDFFVHFLFDKIYASNFLCRWESSIPYIFRQKSCENLMFLQFLAKSWFLLIFMYIFNASKFPKVQYYLFWYQWIEKIHNYTLVANVSVSCIQCRKSREVVVTNPPPPLRRTCCKNYLRRTRVNGSIYLLLFKLLFPVLNLLHHLGSCFHQCFNGKLITQCVWQVRLTTLHFVLFPFKYWFALC